LALKIKLYGFLYWSLVHSTVKNKDIFEYSAEYSKIRRRHSAGAMKSRLWNVGGLVRGCAEVGRAVFRRKLTAVPTENARFFNVVLKFFPKNLKADLFKRERGIF